MRMVLMLAPTNVSRVGPATERREYISVTTEYEKEETPLRLTVLIQLFFSCPGFHGGATPAPSSSTTCTPDDHARACSRGLVLFSNIVHSLLLTQKVWPTSQSITHHVVRPSQWSYYVVIGTGTLAKLKSSSIAPSQTPVCPPKAGKWQ